MSRHAGLLAAAAALVGAGFFGWGARGLAAPPGGHAPSFHTPPASSFHAPPASSFRVPPVFIAPTPQPHAFVQPSRSFAEPPLAAYWRSHYYNGVYPHADNYSYYDLPPNHAYGRAPSYGTIFDLGGGTSTLGPLYPDEYSFANQGMRQPGPAQQDAIARIMVKVPDDAEVKFDGYKTTSTGPVRSFETPLLEPGKGYVYTVEARWQENGRTITQKKDIPVSAGSNVQLDFPLPPDRPKEK
jgi:uncharacterized protein (TIGR03000 family)